jgi:hypothetical protein
MTAKGLNQVKFISALRYQNEPTRPVLRLRRVVLPAAKREPSRGDSHGDESSCTEADILPPFGGGGFGRWAVAPARRRSRSGSAAFLSVTGPAAFLGDPELKTLETVRRARSMPAGGVLGRKLQLVAYDDAGDAEKARTFAKRLIEQDKVDVIVGGRPPARRWPRCRWSSRPACPSYRWPARW